MLKYDKYLFLTATSFLFFSLFFFVFIDKIQNQENIQPKSSNKFEFPLFDKTEITTNFFTPLSSPNKPSVTKIADEVKPNDSDKNNINEALSQQKAFILEPITSPVDPLVQKKGLKEPEISAKSYVIYDIYNKTPLTIKNPNIPLRIASLTKILAAMVISDFFELSEHINVPKEITSLEESERIFQISDEIPIYDLIEAMIVASSNEAVTILENYFEYKTKLNFIEQLNKKALEIGMTKSKFSNAVGYDTSENISTIFDLITLAKAAEKYPFFKEFAYKKQTLVKGKNKNYLFKSTNNQFIDSINKLSKDNENNILLLKTGTTLMAKENLITHFIYKNRNIVVIILGSNDRVNDFAKITNYLQQFFSD